MPPQLQQALEIQAGLREEVGNQNPAAFHINQRDEGIDLNGVSGALMATQNMQMQTFVTQPTKSEAIGFDGYNGDITGDVSATLGTNCGMSTGRNGIMHPVAFAANQRDEVRDLHDVAGAIGAQPGIKQQTFVEAGVVTKGNGDCFLTEDVHTSLTGGGGQAGQGYPCVLCLNDQGGQFMNCSENITGTLRAQMNAHQPLILESNQDHATVRTDGISPTIPASMGMGGGYVPMIETIPEVYCIVGNVIDRQPENGGNGCGYQEDVAYTLTAMDRHAICNTTYQQVVGALCRGDEKGVGSQYVSQDKCIVESPSLIRRLTPLECERLQGFPDEWTNIPSASDSARYKALGNSVAIPCVDFVMRGIAMVLREVRRRRVGPNNWRVVRTIAA